MDTLNPGRAWRKRDDQLVVRKVYSEEFRRDAVELYRTTEGSTVASIAADLGIMDTTLSTWLKAAGVPIRGRYEAGARRFLRVQRWSEGAWKTFPVPAKVKATGEFTAYVELETPGEHRLRLLQSDSGVASKPFVVVIRD